MKRKLEDTNILYTLSKRHKKNESNLFNSRRLYQKKVKKYVEPISNPHAEVENLTKKKYTKEEVKVLLDAKEEIISKAYDHILSRLVDDSLSASTQKLSMSSDSVNDSTQDSVCSYIS
jgi:hypothetical protein